MRRNPWLIVGAIALGVVGLGLIVWNVGGQFGGRSLPPPPDERWLYDIESGEIFRYPGTSILVPMEHPDTGEWTLYPLNEFPPGNSSGPDGESIEPGWYLERRYLAEVGDVEAMPDNLDAETGRIVDGLPSNPRVLKR